jgi:NAD(P)-dependent dehydrogenase (short-subunit alcohol dehydrogenase family)
MSLPALADRVVVIIGGSGRRLGDGPLHEMTDEGLRGTLQLNLHSVMLSNRAAVRCFLAEAMSGRSPI